jgi:hypothetical protein
MDRLIPWKHRVVPPDSVNMFVEGEQIIVWAESETGLTSPRVQDGLLHLWRFEEGGGAQVADWKGGVHLSIQDPGAVQWVEGGGLRILEATALTTNLDQLTAIGGLTVEAWVKPGANQHGRVFSWSEKKGIVNLELRQADTEYALLCRGDDDGRPVLSTSGDLAVPELTHLVWTASAETGQDLLTLNGERVLEGGRSLAAFDPFPLTVGNIPDGDRPWLGDIHLLALYNRPLSSAEITQNFSAGPHPEKVPVEPEPERLSDLVQQVAWRLVGIPHNPTAALSVRAGQLGLGAPLTAEFDFEHKGVLYRGQGYALGIVYCEVGQWGLVWTVLW